MCSIKDIGHLPRNIWKFRWTMIRVLGIKIKSLDSTTLSQTSWNDIGRKMSPEVRDLSESSGAWSQWVLRCVISVSPQVRDLNESLGAWSQSLLVYWRLQIILVLWRELQLDDVPFFIHLFVFLSLFLLHLFPRCIVYLQWPLQKEF